MDLEEQILRLYLKKYSIFLFFIIFLILFYFLIVKDLEFKNQKIYIKKNQSISSIVTQNINENNLLLINFYDFIAKFYNKYISNVHYGEFQLNNKNNIIDFLKIISQPSNIINKITIIEGWSKFDLYERLKIKFNDPEIIDYEQILADTYYLNDYNDFSLFKNKLIKVKNEYLLKISNNKIFKSFSELEIITIGSLIEKEGLNSIDKKKIYSVIINRLNKNMKLQIDATVLYAITDGKYNLKRKLTYNDLKYVHPYNTYIINGLPPKPITYVSTKTIELMLENYKSDYLFYFFDKFANMHIFSKNFEEHKEKLYEYRNKK